MSGTRSQLGKRMWTYGPTSPLHRVPNAITHGIPPRYWSTSVAERNLIMRWKSMSRHVHIAIDVDHGLGDRHFVADPIFAIFAVADGRTCSWMITDDSRLHPRSCSAACPYIGSRVCWRRQFQSTRRYSSQGTVASWDRRFGDILRRGDSGISSGARRVSSIFAMRRQPRHSSKRRGRTS
jgi:hypothetical protein